MLAKTTAIETDRSVTDRLVAKVEQLGRPGQAPLPGDDDFLDWIAAVHTAGHITTGEALEREESHRLVLASQETF